MYGSWLVVDFFFYEGVEVVFFCSSSVLQDFKWFVLCWVVCVIGDDNFVSGDGDNLVVFYFYCGFGVVNEVGDVRV